jgi:drug/metabolite transporter (DMT)-like permease
MRFEGELAALGTAVCWAAGSNLFAAAGARMGSVVLNRLRITVAAAFLAVALTAVRGAPWPTWATPAQIGILAVSGLVGFVFGDNNYFRSLVILGPGRAALIASLAPLFTAALGVPVLGETLGARAMLGVALTIGGLVWVLGGSDRNGPPHAEGSVWVGILAGVLGALGQAGGYVLSKLALRQGLDALSATTIRVSAAMVGVWLVAAAFGQVRSSVAVLRERGGAGFMVGGAFCGPFLGVTLSLVALEHTEAAVAASITAIYPILTLFLSNRFHGEAITSRSLLGALLTVTGVIVLFTR